jgi:hypothetical protein
VHDFFSRGIGMRREQLYNMEWIYFINHARQAATPSASRKEYLWALALLDYPEWSLAK